LDVPALNSLAVGTGGSGFVYQMPPLAAYDFLTINTAWNCYKKAKESFKNFLVGFPAPFPPTFYSFVLQ